MMLRVLALSLIITAVVVAATRESGADPSPAGRYQITGTEARVWRVDTITGELRTCYQVRKNGDRMFRCIDLR